MAHYHGKPTRINAGQAAAMGWQHEGNMAVKDSGRGNRGLYKMRHGAKAGKTTRRRGAGAQVRTKAKRSGGY